ncbi:Hypp5686 [Branchiostoma lanceolatum]|uniref:Hypp5686 protein n=1 Tax=Branchiostoma lanceolatum TaxID=7740 RepID=A0A8J9W770_BRALA|nr:Hypp5686 [Branchiostoma lanceolatum]
MGVQVGAVGIPLHILFKLSEDPTGESNGLPVQRLRLQESHWSAMKMGATQYSFHCVTEALPAETVSTTEAQVHHYENDDEADADEEVQHHLYASAAPPPLPVYEETTAHAVNTEGVSEQPVFQAENVGTGEEEMPYGVAKANSLYQRDSDFNHGTLGASEHTSTNAANYCATDSNGMEERLDATAAAEANTLYYQPDTAPNGTSEHSSSATATYCANDATRMEERLDATAEANMLYQRDTAPNSRTLTSEHTCSAALNCCAAVVNQTETGTADLYGQRTDHTDMARDIATTSRDSVEDLGILYGSFAATVE